MVARKTSWLAAPVAGMLLGSISLPAASAELDNHMLERLTEINTNGADSTPTNFVQMGGKQYFIAYTPEHGTELRVSDGTDAGTQLLKDVYPGPTAGVSRSPQPAVATIGGQEYLFFRGRDPEHGYELWVSDGTEAGTRLVEDIEPGSESSYPDRIMPIGNAIAFRATTAGEGTELWSSQGDAANTLMVKDINPGSGDGNPSRLTVSGTTLFFRATDGSSYNLWKSNGTEAGTVLVKDIGTGAGYDNALVIAADGSNGVWFRANDGSNGQELWHSDGTAAGTAMVKDINPGLASSYPFELTMVGSKLLFIADNDTNGTELWMSDGTEAGTIMIEDINPGPADSQPSGLTNMGGVAVAFSADDGTHGREFWTSDGVTTAMIKDINPGANTSTGSTTTIVRNNALLWFIADDGTHGFELWKSDGTDAGTTMVKDIAADSQDIVGQYNTGNISPYASGVIFQALSADTGVEAWVSDGTDAGTTVLADVRTETADSVSYSMDNEIVELDGTVIFAADDGIHGTELWTVAADGPVMLADIAPGPESSHPSYLVRFGDAIYFHANDQTHGPELWRTDGTEAGTEMVTEVEPGAGGSAVLLTVLGDKLYFVGNNSTYGNELWVSDGTAGGTKLLTDLNPGGNSSPRYLMVVAGKLVFVASDGSTGRELWISDGTAGGTERLTDIGPGTAGARIFDMTPAGDRLFFTARDPGVGESLWVSDLTVSGTELVKDIDATSADLNLRSVTPLADGRVMMSADDGVHGSETWISDGTEAGTMMLKDIAAGAESSDSYGYIEFQGNVYFQAYTSAKGYELYRYLPGDDTVELFKEVDPTDRGWGLYGFSVLGDTLFFIGDDVTHGAELWMSDGTADGTKLAHDVFPGAAPAEPHIVLHDGKDAYLTASDAEHGRELWKLTRKATGNAPGDDGSDDDDSGSGSAGGGSTGGATGGGGGLFSWLALVALLLQASVRHKTGPRQT